MSAIIESLMLDLVAWVTREERGEADVMDAWRTSCPRLTVWEDAVDLGLLRREIDPVRGTVVVATAAGLAMLAAHGRECGPIEGQGTAVAPVAAAPPRARAR